jgi:rhomboid protease GluP
MATPPESLRNDAPPQTNATTLDPQKPSLKDWFRSATIVLIALNVLVFLVMVLSGVSAISPSADSVLKWGADYGPLTLHGQWWRMEVSTFLHFGIIHILFNMYVLFSIGLFMESLAGRVPFLITYTVAGLGGSAASLAWHPTIVSAGASGAIFGLYGALLGFLVRHRGVIPAQSIASLRGSALTFVGYNLLFGLRPGVDMSAHLGGLATGFVLGLFLIEPQPTFRFSPDSEEPTAPTAELQPASNWRIPTAIVLGLALIAIPMIAYPKPDDYLAEYKRFGDMEDKAIDLFTSSTKQWKANQISPDQYADILEKQILPPWHAEIAAMQKLKVPKNQLPTKALLILYLANREEGWQLTAKGVRTNDSDLLKQGAQKDAEAEKAAAKLEGK